MEKENWPLWNGHSSAWGLLSEKTFIFIPNLTNRLDEKKKKNFLCETVTRLPDIDICFSYAPFYHEKFPTDFVTTT